MQEVIRKKVKELLSDKTVTRAIGWESGEFFYDHTPAIFDSADEVSSLVYDCFSGSNLSKYLIKNTAPEGKTLVLLKPCDTYSFNQLLNEHRIDKDKIYVLGVGCKGMADIDKIRAKGIKGIEKIEQKGDDLIISTIYGEKTCKLADVLLEKCVSCKGKKHMIYDELISDNEDEAVKPSERFDLVDKLEKMTSEERFKFWQGELSKCIRCNACRNVCPACSCRTCVFDNSHSGVASKANADSFEEKMFHIIRAFHVAGRCTDCGECSRVCPQGIPLHLLNRKFIKDINSLYGDYQAGATADQRGPLTNFTQEDVEPTFISDKEGK
jgi:heterodisulfide reductase subunit C